MSLTVNPQQPTAQPVQQTGRFRAGQANRPEHELALEAQPFHKPDDFRPSAELSEAQTVKPAGELKKDQKIQELKKRTERTRTQAARNRRGGPKSSEARGAANVQAPRPPEPASATKQVKQAGTGQTQMGERKRPRVMDRESYINNLKATFGA